MVVAVAVVLLLVALATLPVRVGTRGACPTAAVGCKAPRDCVCGPDEEEEEEGERGIIP